MSEPNTDLKNHFKKLAEKWPSAFVAREKVGIFSGGILNSRRMANLDCIGQGPLERIRIGRKVCYPVNPLIDWMIERAQILD